MGTRGFLDNWFVLPLVLGAALAGAGLAVRRLTHRLAEETAAHRSLGEEVRKLTATSEKRIRELRTLYESSLSVERAKDPGPLAVALADDARQIAGGDVACVFTAEGGRLRTVGHAASGRTVQFPLVAGEPVPPGGIAARLLSTGEPIVCPGGQKDGRVAGAPDVARTGVRSLLAVPLRSEGRTLGGILLGSDAEGVFTGEEVRVLTVLAALGATALERLRVGGDLARRVDELVLENRQVQSLDEARRALAASLARELRTPAEAIERLGDVLGGVETGPGSRLRRPVTGAMLREAERIRRLGIELESMAGGSEVWEGSEENLADLLREIIVPHTSSAVRRGVLLKPPASLVEPLVYCHRESLREGLKALLAHVVGGAREGSALAVDLEVEPGRARIVLAGEAVEGFADDLADRLDRSPAPLAGRRREKDAAALALALTRSTVELHGGSVSVEPQVRGLFRVSVTLPTGPAVPTLPRAFLHDLAPGGASARILQALTDLTAEITGARRSALLFLDASAGDLYVQAACGFDEVEVRHLRVPLGEGLAGRVAGTGAPVLDRREGPTGGASRVAVPIRRGPEVLGVLEVADREDGSGFGDPDLHLLQHLAGLLGRALTRNPDPRRIREDLLEALGLMASVAGAGAPREERAAAEISPRNREEIAC